MRWITLLALVALAIAASRASAAPPTRIVCPIASPPNAYLASWSPNGDRIAIAVAVGPDTELWEIAADGTAEVGGFESPFDSPPSAIALSSGNQLAYVKRTGEIDIASENARTIQIGARTTPNVTTGLGGWSPDGTRVVYTRGTYDPAESSVRSTMFVYDTRTGSTKAIGTGSQPSWSPDGTWIAFTDAAEPIGLGIPARELGIVHPDGSDRRRLLHDVALYGPTWSPDGSHLAFEWAIDRAPHVETIVLDGSDRRDVAYTYGPVFWIPAGLVIDLPSPDYGTAVAVVNPANGKAHVITHAPIRIYSSAAVAVPADGRWVAYTIGSSEGNPAFGIRVVLSNGTGDRSLLDCLGTGDAERLVGSPLPDVIRAGAGNDVIDVRRGGVDTVYCGLGRDTVYADPHDHVARDCERVRRS